MPEPRYAPCTYCGAPTNVNDPNWYTSCPDCQEPRCLTCSRAFQLDPDCVDCSIQQQRDEVRAAERQLAKQQRLLQKLENAVPVARVAERIRRQRELDDEVRAMARSNLGLRSKHLLLPLITFIAHTLCGTNTALARRAFDAKAHLKELIDEHVDAWAPGTQPHRLNISLFVSSTRVGQLPAVVADYCKVFAATWSECKKKKSLL